MNPTDAVAILAGMDASDAAPILADMDASDAAPILADMDASRDLHELIVTQTAQDMLNSEASVIENNGHEIVNIVNSPDFAIDVIQEMFKSKPDIPCFLIGELLQLDSTAMIGFINDFINDFITDSNTNTVDAQLLIETVANIDVKLATSLATTLGFAVASAETQEHPNETSSSSATDHPENCLSSMPAWITLMLSQIPATAMSIMSKAQMETLIVSAGEMLDKGG